MRDFVIDNPFGMFSCAEHLHERAIDGFQTDF
jgi:hypothetical protein